ncbi:NACHT, LRR and PYD domains-containing protein 7-like isoform X2 [Melanotaenia boesemani]|uniref:NACHT, LRR and PYD domains-containing protein 7-like isoform X2 n=1 Tax=Melanotaenia boesemani TaxID=1250792 RepID=UPI001C053D8D|nr:NACHT, LRR and PYD domains-containing protein 7-like isoform X2 [Melanotaenia boesemani]
MSDQSIDKPPDFSDRPGPSDSERTRSGVFEEEQLSCCPLCQDVLKDPVSTSCGHWFCRRCISSYWDQSASSGGSSCPQCGKRPRTRTGLQTAGQSRTVTDVGLQEVLDEHKISLRRRCEHVTEGTDGTGSRTLLNRIYTELFITEGQSEEVNTQHEVRQLETASKINTLHDTPIRCHDIFKALPDQHGPIRVVLTNGVAGVGKTFSVQKFTLDWAEGLENQDVSVVVLLSFRELNLIRDDQYSLLQLLHVFHPTLQKIPAEQLAVWKLLFIFDGLDESRLSLDFNNTEVVSDVTQKSSVNVLLTNLIKGNLLPSALIWITSRPAAANQIPPTCVDRVTEVRGFNDVQKEEYFRRRFSDEEMYSRIISHMKTSRSLHIMCGIPVFCWITATVLEHMLTTEQRGELPKTMTDLYSHFLMVQTKRKKNKYHEGHKTSPQELMETDREVLLKLGRLAFEHLEKGNIMFYQEDLEQCGLDVTEASVFSGVCTEIFRKECVIFQKPVYCFVHLSVQEFLAAVYMMHCYINKNTEVVEEFLGNDNDEGDNEDDDDYDDDDDNDDDDDDKDEDDDGFIIDDHSDDEDDDDDNNSSSSSVDDDDTDDPNICLDVFLRRVMKKYLESRNGHLDLFVRFLHGLSLESNQKLLRILLGQTDNNPETIQKVIRNLKKMNDWDISPDRLINIVHCLMEMNDFSDFQEIEKFLMSDKRSMKKLSEIQCSALAYVMQMSEVLDELDLNKYRTSIKGKQRLIPAVRNCREARLSDCELSVIHCNTVAAALRSNPSPLRTLDLSNNYLEDAGVEVLSTGLENAHCKLETLSLINCEITARGCASLGSALKANPSHLRELNLSDNMLEDTGVVQLCGFLESPQCRLKILRLRACGLLEISCLPLVSALKFNPSHLIELDLGQNKLQNSGVKLLCDLLENPYCRLETLRVSKCQVTHERCYSLASVFKSKTSHLKELDLSQNKLKDLGLKHLCTGLKNPNCRLETLRLQKCGLSEITSLVSVLKSSTCPLKEVDLRGNKMPDSVEKELSDLMESPCCRLEKLRFSSAGSSVELTRLKKSERAGVMEDKSDCSSDPTIPIMPEDKEMFKQQKLLGSDTLTVPALWKGAQTELLTESGKPLYRLRSPGPGTVRCNWTGLVFVLTRGAELQYRTVQWDENQLQSSGMIPAGPLFEIKCSEDAVCQLHLPHCETSDAHLSESLSVVHISDDGMSRLKPLEITDTHVVVNVTHLSAFGLVINFLKRLWNNTKPVKGQVLLFLRPPNIKTKTQNLNVFLLPCNVPVEEVKARQQGSGFIQAPSNCRLIKDRSYTVYCSEALKVQPKKADFDLDFGPNYHPTFEIRLPTNTEEVAVMVRDQTQMKVWEHEVYLTDTLQHEENLPTVQSDSPEQRLFSVRTRFIQSVSEPTLKQLLDKLHQEDVINREEMATAKAKSKADMARDIIDVKDKGAEASHCLIDSLRQVDPRLFRALNLS